MVWIIEEQIGTETEMLFVTTDESSARQKFAELFASLREHSPETEPELDDTVIRATFCHECCGPEPVYYLIDDSKED